MTGGGTRPAPAAAPPRAEVERLLGELLGRCPEAAEAVFQESDEALTRFADNEVHQSVRARRRSVTLRAWLGRRCGVASSSRSDSAALAALAERALEMARLSPEDPEAAGLPGPAEYPPLAGWDAATADCPPEERAERARRVIEAARARGLTAAGAVSTRGTAAAVANTRGVFAYHPATLAHFTCTVMGADSSGWSEGFARDLGGIDTAALGERAIDKALRSAAPAALPAGRYTVVLEANAVAELVAFLGWTGFGAQSYQEGSSFLNGRLGERVTGERIRIVDDAFDPRTLGMPFDFEGVPKRRVPLVEGGVARGLVHDTASARRAGVESTGHALPPPNPEGPLPFDLVVGTGDDTVEGMVARVGRGILVTRLWYNRVVDPRNTVITGMTRDGTFLIEDGRVTRGLRNLRYNESVLDVLARAEGIGRTASPTVFDYTGNCVVAPALLVREFRFTGVTEF